jgi:hypothetical protein
MPLDCGTSSWRAKTSYVHVAQRLLYLRQRGQARGVAQEPSVLAQVGEARERHVRAVVEPEQVCQRTQCGLGHGSGQSRERDAARRLRPMALMTPGT